MMERPKPLSVEDLKAMESLVPGEGARLADLWCQEYESYLEERRADREQQALEH